MTEKIPLLLPSGQVVVTKAYGKTVRFLINEPRDVIQKHHLDGEFYETEELEIIKRYFPFGGSFFDIGANVGNHSLYAAKFLHAAHVVPVEVNPLVYEVLKANVYLNDLNEIFDFSMLGFGVSDVEIETASINFKRRNIGGGRVQDTGGELKLLTADTIADGRHFDFIKIDVEGMEMRVLEGLSNTIEHSKPVMFIEVDNVNAEAFEAWVKKNGYKIRERFKRYRVNENFLITPLRPRLWEEARKKLKET